MHFAIHPAADYARESAVGQGPVKVAFMIFDLPAMVEWLGQCGIPLCYPPADLGDQSRITAVRDRDGNLVELTQLGPGCGRARPPADLPGGAGYSAGSRSMRIHSWAEAPVLT